MLFRESEAHVAHANSFFYLNKLLRSTKRSVKVLTTSLLFLLCVSIAQLAQAQTFSISGDISLPDGTVAPAGGTVFTISTDPLESFAVGGGFLESAITVTIAGSQQITSYSLTMRDDDPQGGMLKKLRFNCDSGCDDLGALTQGYWSEINGVVGEANATQYAATQNHVANIELLNADVFSGSVQLPDDFVANGNEGIIVVARASSFSNPVTFSQTITTTADETSWPFFIAVPQLTGVGGWSIEVTCGSCDEDISSATHYPTTATGDPMTIEPTEDFFFIAFKSFTDMQMTLISIAEPEEPTVNVMGAIQVLLLDD